MPSPVCAFARRRLAISIAVSLWLLALTAGGASASTAAGAGVVGGEQLATAGVVVDLGPGALAPPDTEAASYVVVDLATGDVLAAKAAHERLPPASTLKLLAALVLLPALDKDEVVVGTDAEVAIEGSKVGISAGLSYPVDLLFKAMLIDSGNDATHALARVAGGVEQTVAAMNATAAELGAMDTFVVNPTGLDEPGQLTSAYDLALIGRAALHREDFLTYATTPTADLPAEDGTTYQIQNGNRLLGAYEGLIGGKNGYTTLARHTYVGAAERGGRAYLVTVMRTEGRGEEVAATLLDWAFVNGPSVEPVGELVEPIMVPGASALAEVPATTPAVPTSGPPVVQAVADTAAAATAEDGGPGAVTIAGLVGVGMVGAVAGLRIRAVRRDRLRRERMRRTRPPQRQPMTRHRA